MRLDIRIHKVSFFFTMACRLREGQNIQARDPDLTSIDSIRFGTRPIGVNLSSVKEHAFALSMWVRVGVVLDIDVGDW